MKKLCKTTVILGILAGIGYLICTKMCKKEDCGCKK